MPQPSPGLWFLSVRPLNCTGAEDEELYLNVTLSGCINDCGEKEGRGNCQTFYSQGGVLMSSCRCKAGKNSQKFASKIIKLLRSHNLSVGNVLLINLKVEKKLLIKLKIH